MTQTLEEYAQEIVHIEAFPPRQVSLAQTVKRSIAFSESALMLFGLAAFGASLLEVCVEQKYILGIAGIAAGTLLLLLPLLSSLQVFRALRYGVVAEAEIYELQKVRPGHSRKTFRSYKNGYIEGRWRVREAAIDEPYFVDDAWAQDATLGSRVAVLLHPNGKRIVLPIGLARRP